MTRKGIRCASGFAGVPATFAMRESNIYWTDFVTFLAYPGDRRNDLLLGTPFGICRSLCLSGELRLSCRV